MSVTVSPLKATNRAMNPPIAPAHRVRRESSSFWVHLAVDDDS